MPRLSVGLCAITVALSPHYVTAGSDIEIFRKALGQMSSDLGLDEQHISEYRGKALKVMERLQNEIESITKSAERDLQLAYHSAYLDKDSKQKDLHIFEDKHGHAAASGGNIQAERAQYDATSAERIRGYTARVEKQKGQVRVKEEKVAKNPADQNAKEALQKEKDSLDTLNKELNRLTLEREKQLEEYENLLRQAMAGEHTGELDRLRDEVKKATKNLQYSEEAATEYESYWLETSNLSKQLSKLESNLNGEVDEWGGYEEGQNWVRYEEGHDGEWQGY